MNRGLNAKQWERIRAHMCHISHAKALETKATLRTELKAAATNNPNCTRKISEEEFEEALKFTFDAPQREPIVAFTSGSSR